jgi:hypothetical protein
MLIFIDIDNIIICVEFILLRLILYCDKKQWHSKKRQ